jgi:transposase
MERYLGIDAHDQSSTIAVLGPSGRLLQRIVVETTPRALIDAVKTIAGKKKLCLEESPLSEWLYELLEKHVEYIEVVQAEANRATKSDARDARWLAEALRTNAKRRRVFKAKTEQRELREAVRAYYVTVSDLSRSKNRLNALMRSRAIRPDTTGLYDAATRERWTNKLPSVFRPRAELFGQIVDAASTAQSKATEQLEAVAKKNCDVKRLMSAPGIGLVRAATIVAVVVTPHRFRTTRQFWAYCGFAVVTHATSEWSKAPKGEMRRRKDVVRTRGLNSNRHPWLKSVFKGAAHTVMTQLPQHPLAVHYRQMVESGIDPSLAWLTISRRIAAAVLSMWKKEEEYNASKQEPKKTAA